MREMRKIFILMVVVFGFGILFSSEGHADKWVCYTYDEVDEDELKAAARDHSGSSSIPVEILETTGSNTEIVYSQTSFLRTCEADTGGTFMSCPENEYYQVETLESDRRCTSFSGAFTEYTHYNDKGEIVADCGRDGSPSCNNWEDIGGFEQTDVDYVCGMDNESWVEMDASDWICPSCKELAERDQEIPQLDLSNFDALSFNSFPHFSSTQKDLSFMAYVEACINRIPMLNLEVSVNDGMEDLSSLTGIYARHNTLDYNHENLGRLNEFDMPEQDNFREAYTLRGDLKGYRAWAWRGRLVDAIERTSELNNLQIPGYPDTLQEQTIGDLFYSSDFLAGMVEEFETTNSCEGSISSNQTYATNVLVSMDELGSQETCTVDDIGDYYQTYGMNSVLKDELRDVMNIPESTEITGISSLGSGGDTPISYSLAFDFEINEIGYDNMTELMNELNDDENHEDFYDLFRDEGILSDSLLYDGAYDSTNYIFSDSKACGSYEPSYTSYELSGDFTEINQIGGSDRVELMVPISAELVNDISMNIDLEVEIEHDCDAVWDWMNFGELEPRTFAKCLYNFDDCILNERTLDSGNLDHEVAACGMGPPSSNLETTLKDGARGDTHLEQEITVYRNCESNDNWIAGEKQHACKEGEIYRCYFEPSLDTVDFVEKVEAGETININDDWYVCLGDGTWNSVYCE